MSTCPVAFETVTVSRKDIGEVGDENDGVADGISEGVIDVPCGILFAKRLHTFRGDGNKTSM